MSVFPPPDASRSWLRDIATFMSDRHIRARKFATDGSPLWFSPVEVYNATSVHLGYDPCLAHDPGTGEIYLFWNERNSSQSQWGIYGQKLNAAGARQWGEGGLELRPVD